MRPVSNLLQFPVDKIDIKPETMECSLSMAIIGLRDIVPSIDLFPVNKVFCKFDISGDSKHPVLTNKHAVFSGSADVLEIITIDVSVPKDLQYSPTLTVYVYDNITGLGGLGDRLVGVASIPLTEHCKSLLASLDKKVLKSSKLGASVARVIEGPKDKARAFLG